jgi:preprotein translocase subunit SecE
MNRRQALLSILWVVGFNLSVALVAIYWGIGLAIAILCLRHILLGIPVVYDRWRGLFLVSTESITIVSTHQKWPNRKWLIKTILLVVFAVIIIVKANIPLKDFLFGI